MPTGLMIAEQEKIKGSNTLCNKCLRKQKHISHFTLDEAVALVQELNIPNAWFTHISHQLGLHSQIDAELPNGMHLAYDGLELNFL
jgi:phosphoribosyl 1,2-cyclic phosphate phosphodiesterase